jgi:1-acyl-sn-glycerol-3-phosphate acyltransferase
VRVLGKDTLFWWPLSIVLHRLGVIPLDRSNPQGVVEQAIELIRSSPKKRQSDSDSSASHSDG